LAHFNLDDSKLCGRDVVAVRVDDVAEWLRTRSRIVRQRKTGLPVRFEVTNYTRGAQRPSSSTPARYLGIEIDDAIEIAEKIEIGCNWAVRGGSAQCSTN